MWELFAVLAGQWPGIILGVGLTAVLARSNHLWTSRHTIQDRAAAELLVRLATVERLVRAWRFGKVSVPDVNTTMDAWDQGWRQYGGLLPWGWAHLDRDVRLAIGNSLGGGAALAADTPLNDGWSPETYEDHWWDISLTFIEHVRACLHEFRLSRGVHQRNVAPSTYYHWRKSEDEDFFAEPAPRHRNEAGGRR